MRRASTQAASPRRVCVLDACGESVRVLTAERTNGAIRVVNARTIDVDGIESAVRAADADVLIHVVCASQTIARITNAPLEGLDDLQKRAALDVLARTQLPEAIPAHRRSAGVIGAGPAGDRVLLTGWPVRDGDHPVQIARMADQHWISRGACLAVLAGPGEGVSAWRGAGGACAIAHGPRGSIARSCVIRDDAHWRTILAETCEAAGLPDGADHDTSFMLARSIDVQGAGSGEWLGEYGIALGAAIAALGDERVQSLAGLTPEPARTHEPIHRRARAWLAAPPNAYATMGVCAVLMLLAPLGLAALRLAVLEAKASAITDAAEGLDSVRAQASMYESLAQSRWPMTRLLASAASAAPVGITTDDLRLSTRRGLHVEGSAESYETIIAFQQRLSATEIFANVRIESTDAAQAGRVGFTLTSDVAAPLRFAEPTEDFASHTLAERLYGPGAPNAAFVANTEGGNVGSAHAPARVAGAAPSATHDENSQDDALPAPLHDEDLKAMDRMALMRAWVQRRAYVQQHPELDAGDRERLKREIERLQGMTRRGGNP